MTKLCSMFLKIFFVQVPKTQQIQLKNNIKLLSCQSKNKLHQPGQCESAPDDLQLFPGELHLMQRTKFCSSLQKYLICMQQDKLVATHLYSSKTSPFSRIHYMHFEMSATGPLHLSFRTCCRHDNNLQGHQEHLPTSLSARHCCCPLPHQPAHPCSLCASAGRATSSLHGVKPSLKK